MFKTAVVRDLLVYGRASSTPSLVLIRYNRATNLSKKKTIGSRLDCVGKLMVPGLLLLHYLVFINIIPFRSRLD